MKLQIAGNEGHLVRLQVDGHITQRDLTPGGDPLSDLLGPEAYTKLVLVDLSRSPIIDSSGLSWLIRADKRFREKGGRLVIHSCSPLIGDILKLTKVDPALKLASSLKDAEMLVQEARL